MDIKQLFFWRKQPAEMQQPVDSEKSGHGQKFVPAADNILRQRIIDAMRTVYDPEIHINIYDLGLIYHIEIDDENRVGIEMTLTAPACPVAEILPAQVETVVRAVPGVKDVNIKLVWDPPWDQSRISETARLELGLL